MKPVVFISVLTAFIFSQPLTAQVNDNYDSALAKKLQADDYGMKSYVLVMLKTGSSTDTAKATLSTVFGGHMANIKRLASENKLLLAGPIGENDKNYEGLFVFNTADVNEAKQWLSSDPAVQSKHLDAEVYAWYGPAALQEVVNINQKVTKKSY
jgi:uncharacterized protein YciI